MRLNNKKRFRLPYIFFFFHVQDLPGWGFFVATTLDHPSTCEERKMMTGVGSSTASLDYDT